MREASRSRDLEKPEGGWASKGNEPHRPPPALGAIPKLTGNGGKQVALFTQVCHSSRLKSSQPLRHLREGPSSGSSRPLSSLEQQGFIPVVLTIACFSVRACNKLSF
ncbi:hypothetical protein Vafri_4864, partial [Volvox africanus]